VAPLSQTFHALKTRLAEETNLNPQQLRFLLKNKAIGDSKSVQEVFGETEEASITVMVMKTPAASVASGTAGNAAAAEGDKMDVDHDAFWEGVKEAVMAKYQGGHDKEKVFAALKKGYQDTFGG